MLANASRDAEKLPALAAVLAPFGQFLSGVRADLWAAWPVDDIARPRLAAAIGHALRYDTWRSLAHVEGLDDAAAADLMVGLARATVGAHVAPPRIIRIVPSEQSGARSTFHRLT